MKTKAIKGGRCWNANHKDKGIIIHIVEEMEKNTGGVWNNKAECGETPGKKSYGWTESNKEVNCKRCLKKQK